MIARIGLIVIGRNEGSRLGLALDSCVAEKNVGYLYVDSGSTDDSVALARSREIVVHELDSARPFSPGRARREGVDIILKIHPEVKYIQFLDGDCTLENGWVVRAAEYLENHKDVAIVCGLLQEATPDQSVYNRINAIQWNAPPGEVGSCGGIFMIRRSAYQEVGGFNASLLTGEEPELCSRIRAAGHRIMRISLAMACHDSGFVNFADWWKRAIWGGYGDAVEYATLAGKVTSQRRRETRSNILWGLCVPVLALLGIFGMVWHPWLVIVPIFCGVSYMALLAKIMLYRIKNGDSISDSALYAFFCLLRKTPNAIGFLWCQLKPGTTSGRPDPHTPSANK